MLALPGTDEMFFTKGLIKVTNRINLVNAISLSDGVGSIFIGKGERLMKRISMIVIVALTLALMAYAHSRRSKSNSHTPEPQTPPARAKGTALVKQLPAGVVGVELKGSLVQLIPGYKFVKEPNNTVSVARMKGRGNVSGDWNCNCSKDGDCGVAIESGSLSCTMNTCKGSCTLKVTIGLKSTGVLMFAR
jgi:hypothetical protein